MKLKVIGLFAIVLALVVVALSQQPPDAPSPPPPAQQGPQHPPQPPRPPDPIAQNLFPPELVMQNRQALGLSEEQKAAIKDELMKASARFNDLNWQMQDEMETMANLTRGTSVDEQRVLAQLDKILNIEREVKRTQISLSIRLKNKLTAEQQTQLQQLQQQMQPRPPMPR
jgi:Spy/CpxP family protein refolding chaperone